MIMRLMLYPRERIQLIKPADAKKQLLKNVTFYTIIQKNHFVNTCVKRTKYASFIKNILALLVIVLEALVQHIVSFPQASYRHVYGTLHFL